MSAISRRPLSFSIDLEAELKSITERQHLNAVHFTVQLVRHALRQRPTEILIRSTATTFSIEHDGASFDDAERALLFAIVPHGAVQDPAERQRALSALEQRFGIDLLSLLLRESRVTVESAQSFESVRGTLRPSDQRRAVGTRLVVERKRTSRRKERREIVFYAQFADAPIRYNGRRINRQLRIPQVVIEVAHSYAQGGVRLALTRALPLKRIRYFKHGVYYGVRNSAPADGLVVDAIVNSRRVHAEDNFHDSLRDSVGQLRAARQKLLDEIVSKFLNLSKRDRSEVKTRLLEMAPQAWDAGLRDLALFDAVGRRAAYSLDMLRAQSVGRPLVYAPRDSAVENPLLPALTETEASAISRLLEVAVLPTVREAPAGGFFSWWRRRRSRRAKATSDVRETFSPLAPLPFVTEAQLAFAQRLHLPGRFTLDFSHDEGVDQALCGTRVRLRPDRPELDRLLRLAELEALHDAIRVQLEVLAQPQPEKLSVPF